MTNPHASDAATSSVTWRQQSLHVFWQPLTPVPRGFASANCSKTWLDWRLCLPDCLNEWRRKWIAFLPSFRGASFVRVVRPSSFDAVLSWARRMVTISLKLYGISAPRVCVLSHRNLSLFWTILLFLAGLFAARSELRKVLFLAPSVCGVFFVCVWNISGTAERICVKFTRKMCLVPRSDDFEGKGQWSRSPEK